MGYANNHYSLINELDKKWRYPRKPILLVLKYDYDSYTQTQLLISNIIFINGWKLD